jgi:hypothetical protein
MATKKTSDLQTRYEPCLHSSLDISQKLAKVDKNQQTMDQGTHGALILYKKVIVTPWAYLSLRKLTVFSKLILEPLSKQEPVPHLLY